MKKLLVLSAAALLFAGNAAFAQFEGTVVYTMETQGLTPEQAAMMGGSSEFTIYVKGDKSRSEMSMGPVNNVTITDRKEKYQVLLMDMMGNKYMIRQTLEQFNADNNTSKQTVKLIDGETKTIAGYKCKKAEVTSTDKDGKAFTSVVWYTEEFKPTSSTDFSKFNGLPGYPMEFESKQGPYTIKMSVKSIVKGTVADSKFEVPKDGYKVMNSKEEMQKDIQKQMSGGH
jgi:GLPGLI family protein